MTMKLLLLLHVPPPSDRHSQHPPRTPISHHFSQLLQAQLRSRHYLLHPPFSRPSPPPLSTRQHHLRQQTSSRVCIYSFYCINKPVDKPQLSYIVNKIHKIY